MSIVTLSTSSATDENAWDTENDYKRGNKMCIEMKMISPSIQDEAAKETIFKSKKCGRFGLEG